MLLQYSDLGRFPNDNLRREILAGELFVSPSPSVRHQSAVLEIAILLRAYAARHGGKAFVAPLDVVFTDHDVVEPDVIYLGADRIRRAAEAAIHGAPSLLVDILSPSSAAADRSKKRDLYARFGVLEYWIVDLEARTIERCSRPFDGAYAETEIFLDRMPAATLPGLEVSISAVLS